MRRTIASWCRTARAGRTGLRQLRFLDRRRLDLRLDVLEQHRFTSELRLTYAMVDAATGAPDPSAFVRLYRDARQAEATHCHVGRRWQDAIGMYPPSDTLIRHRLRMNTFLGKWLDYLGEQATASRRLPTLADAPAETRLTLPNGHR